MHFLTANWPYGLLVALTGCAVAATPRVMIGRSIDFDDQDALERRTGHRDHEQPGGVL